MTRDRKKLFISSVEKTIAELEQNNKRMRDILAKQAIQYSGGEKNDPSTDSTTSVTPESSPLLSAESTDAVIPPLPTSIALATQDDEKSSIVSAPLPVA